MPLTKANLFNALKNINNFKEISGLKVNLDKTMAVWFGSMSESYTQLCQNIN